MKSDLMYTSVIIVAISLTSCPKRGGKSNSDEMESIACVRMFSFPNSSLLVDRFVEVPMFSDEGRMHRYTGEVLRYQKSTKTWFVRFEDDTEVRGTGNCYKYACLRILSDWIGRLINQDSFDFLDDNDTEDWSIAAPKKGKIQRKRKLEVVAVIGKQMNEGNEMYYMDQVIWVCVSACFIYLATASTEKGWDGQGSKTEEISER